MIPIPSRRPGCPTDLDLEALLSGERGASRHGEHARRCADCAARLAWMREVGRTFEERVMPRTWPSVAGRLPARRHPGPAWLLAPLVFAGAAAALLLLTPRPPGTYVGAKSGGGAMEVWLAREGAALRLADGATAHPGEGLRFAVRAPGRLAMILTVDAAGRVSRLVPAPGAAPPAADGLLPGGAVLDEVLGPERIFSVFLDDPGQVEAVERAARRAAGGGGDAVRRLRRLPLALDQDTLLLEKVPRPR